MKVEPRPQKQIWLLREKFLIEKRDHKKIEVNIKIILEWGKIT